MKKVAGQIVLALVLVAIGGAFWVAGRLEGRVADAHEQPAPLRYTALDAEYGDIDEAMTYARRVPWVADGLVDDVEEHRAASEYRRAHYDVLAPQRDASGAVIDQQPAVLAMAANAAYRTGQRGRQRTAGGAAPARHRGQELRRAVEEGPGQHRRRLQLRISGPVARNDLEGQAGPPRQARGTRRRCCSS